MDTKHWWTKPLRRNGVVLSVGLCETRSLYIKSLFPGFTDSDSRATGFRAMVNISKTCTTGAHGCLAAPHVGLHPADDTEWKMTWFLKPTVPAQQSPWARASGHPSPRGSQARNRTSLSELPWFLFLWRLCPSWGKFFYSCGLLNSKKGVAVNFGQNKAFAQVPSSPEALSGLLVAGTASGGIRVHSLGHVVTCQITKEDLCLKSPSSSVLM